MNKFTIDENGFKLVYATEQSIVTRNKIIRIGSDECAYSFFVCGYIHSIANFDQYGTWDWVYFFKTEEQAKEFCKDKVIYPVERFASSKQEVQNYLNHVR